MQINLGEMTQIGQAKTTRGNNQAQLTDLLIPAVFEKQCFPEVGQAKILFSPPWKVFYRHFPIIS